MLLLLSLCALAAAQHVIPGKVVPTFPATWDMARSTAMMTCNASGPVDAVFASKWGLVDLDVRGWFPAPLFLSALAPPIPLFPAFCHCPCRALLLCLTSTPPPYLFRAAVEWREECVVCHQANECG